MIVVDVAELPKNINGFRTTHTCELCGFEPRTKNKYREKQDHLVMKHFKEKIDKIFPHCRPYACPAANCEFTGKDKQALLRHYTGKHGILERYLREALAEKGINYIPGEGGKRRHSDSSNSSTGSTGVGRGAKNPRLTLTPPQNAATVAAIVEGATELKALAAAPNGAQATTTHQVTLPSKPTSAEELRKEVEAMMRSFQPVIDQPTVMTLQLPQSVMTVNGNGGGGNGTVTVSLPTTPVTSLSAVSTNSNVPMATAIPVATVNGSGNTVVATASNGATAVPVASLPAIVLSAVANATAQSVAANGNGVATNGNVLPTVSLPTQPSDVPTINVTSPIPQQQQQQGTPVILQQQNNNKPVLGAPVASLIANGPSASSLPLPIEVISNGNLSGTTGGKLLSNADLKLSGIRLATTNGNAANLISNGGETSPLSNDDVMWSAVNSAPAVGPAVVVEAANTLPIAYVADASAAGDVISFTTNGVVNGGGGATNGGAAVAAAAAIENIDYDYLYPVSTCGGAGATDSVVASARERQLDFYAL